MESDAKEKAHTILNPWGLMQVKARGVRVIGQVWGARPIQCSGDDGVCRLIGQAGELVQGNLKNGVVEDRDGATQAEIREGTQKMVCPSNLLARQRVAAKRNKKESLTHQWGRVLSQNNSLVKCESEHPDTCKQSQAQRPGAPERQHKLPVGKALAPRQTGRRLSRAAEACAHYMHETKCIVSQLRQGMMVLIKSLAAIFSHPPEQEELAGMKSDDESEHWRRKVGVDTPPIAKATQRVKATAGAQLTTQQKLDATLDECIGSMLPPPARKVQDDDDSWGPWGPQHKAPMAK
eukprot:277764-Amphidinium_carterae.1